MRIPSLLKIKRQVEAKYPDDTLALYKKHSGIHDLERQRTRLLAEWDDLRKTHCRRSLAGEDMSVPCTCEALAKKHRPLVDELNRLADELNAAYASVWAPLMTNRKREEAERLVARNAKLRLKEQRRRP